MLDAIGKVLEVDDDVIVVNRRSTLYKGLRHFKVLKVSKKKVTLLNKEYLNTPDITSGYFIYEYGHHVVKV